MNASTKLRKWGAIVLVTGLSLVAPTAWAEANSERYPKYVSLTPAQEVALGTKDSRDFRASHARSDDAELMARVERVGRVLVAVSDRPNHPFRFEVIVGKQLQAYSFPGERVFVTEAIVRAAMSDDELAFILGHEVAHIALRHQVSQLRLAWTLDRMTSVPEELLRTIQVGFDHDTGMEADRYGVLYAVRAGYRFEAAAKVLTRLSKRPGAAESDELHATYEERLANLRSFRTDLDRSLKAFDRGTTALQALRVDDAVTFLTLFAAEFPDSTAGRINLGAAYLAKVRRNSAPPGNLSEALPILPECSVTRRGEYDSADLTRAEEQFERALGIQPDESMALAGLALVRLRRSDFEGARRLLDRALAGPAGDEPALLLCSGNVDFLAGRYDEAASTYSKALERRPEWAAARRNLDLTYERQRDQSRPRRLWTDPTGRRRYEDAARRNLMHSNQSEQ